MHRRCSAVLFTSWPRLVVGATGISDVSSAKLFASESPKGGRKRPSPQPHAHSGPSESRTPFPESDAAETRRIRTRPRPKDHTAIQRELTTSAAWERAIPSPPGNHLEAPHDDPWSYAELEDGDFDLECLPDSLQRYNPFTKRVDKFDFSMLHLGEEDTSRVIMTLMRLINGLMSRGLGGKGVEVD